MFVEQLANFGENFGPFVPGARVSIDQRYGYRGLRTIGRIGRWTGFLEWKNQEET